MKLTAEQVAEFTRRLTVRKEHLEQELGRFATQTSEGEFKTKFPEDIGTRTDENATEVEEYADKLALEQTLEEQLGDVIDALARMDAGTYGVCEATKREIPIARLEAYPAARTVIDV